MLSVWRKRNSNMVSEQGFGRWGSRQARVSLKRRQAGEKSSRKTRKSQSVTGCWRDTLN